MHFPTTASTTLLTALLTLTTLTPLAAAGVAVLPRHPQNDNRPVPTGECCVPNTSLKQDTCTAASGATGRCVPGGNDCGGALSCVEDAGLECDDSVIERGSSLCRAVAGNGGLFDGANIIQSLADATVN